MNIFKVFFATFIIFFIQIYFVSSIQAKENNKVLKVSANNLRVRSAPNIDATVIGSLKYGDYVHVVRTSTFTETIDGKTAPWVKFLYGKTKGWAFAGYMLDPFGLIKKNLNESGQLTVEQVAKGKNPKESFDILVPGPTAEYYTEEELDNWTAVKCQDQKCQSFLVTPKFVITPPENPDDISETPYSISTESDILFLVKGLSLMKIFPGDYSGRIISYYKYNLPYDLKFAHHSAKLFSENATSVSWSFNGNTKPIFSLDPDGYGYDQFIIIWEGDLNGDGVTDFLAKIEMCGECCGNRYQLFVSNKTDSYDLIVSRRFEGQTDCGVMRIGY